MNGRRKLTDVQLFGRALDAYSKELKKLNYNDLFTSIEIFPFSRTAERGIVLVKRGKLGTHGMMGGRYRVSIRSLDCSNAPFLISDVVNENVNSFNPRCSAIYRLVQRWGLLWRLLEPCAKSIWGVLRKG